MFWIFNLLFLLVNRIKTETGTSIIIPPDTEKSDILRIEGDPMGVKAAKSMLLEMAAKMVCSVVILIAGTPPPLANSKESF